MMDEKIFEPIGESSGYSQADRDGAYAAMAQERDDLKASIKPYQETLEAFSAFHAAVESMVGMLENNEWAEMASHFKAPGNVLAGRLEAQITRVISEMGETAFMLSASQSKLDDIRDALNVASEPAETLHARMLEAARGKDIPNRKAIAWHIPNPTGASASTTDEAHRDQWIADGHKVEPLYP